MQKIGRVIMTLRSESDARPHVIDFNIADTWYALRQFKMQVYAGELVLTDDDTDEVEPVQLGNRWLLSE